MPIEYTLLEYEKIPVKTCPECGEDFVPFLRGTIQRRKTTFWLRKPRPYCSLICSNCKTLIGHESPDRNVGFELIKHDDLKYVVDVNAKRFSGFMYESHNNVIGLLLGVIVFVFWILLHNL